MRQESLTSSLTGFSQAKVDAPDDIEALVTNPTRKLAKRLVATGLLAAAVSAPTTDLRLETLSNHSSFTQSTNLHVDKDLVDFPQTIEAVGETLARTEHLQRILNAELETMPVEAGMMHPAEPLLEASFAHDGSLTTAWLLHVLEHESGAFAADMLLMSMNMLHELDANTLLDAAAIGLSREETQVRDAALQALELRRDQAALHLLTSHDEPVGWLDDYRQSIVSEIRQELA